MTRAYIESCFLQLGAERMSKYFGNEKFENGMLAEYILWNKDDCYYAVIENEEDDFEIMYSYEVGDNYKKYKVLSNALSEEEIRDQVSDIMQGWKPEEEKILEKYIDLHVEEPDKISENVFLKRRDLYSNLIELLFKLKDVADRYLTIRERQWINKLLYKCCSKMYGSTHIRTLNIVCNMAKLLGESKEYEEGILLVKYVQKTAEQKYGVFSEENMRILEILMIHYYKSGAMGRALSLAEKSLNLCVDEGNDHSIWIKKFIAQIYRKDMFQNYEKALKYDLEVYEDIKDRSTLTEEIIYQKDSIAFDYYLMEQLHNAIENELETVMLAADYYGADSPEYRSLMENLSMLLDELEESE